MFVQPLFQENRRGRPCIFGFSISESVVFNKLSSFEQNKLISRKDEHRPQTREKRFGMM